MNYLPCVKCVVNNKDDPVLALYNMFSLCAVQNII